MRFRSDQLGNLICSPKAQALSKTPSKPSTHLFLSPFKPAPRNLTQAKPHQTSHWCSSCSPVKWTALFSPAKAPTTLFQANVYQPHMQVILLIISHPTSSKEKKSGHMRLVEMISSQCFLTVPSTHSLFSMYLLSSLLTNTTSSKEKKSGHMRLVEMISGQCSNHSLFSKYPLSSLFTNTTRSKEK